MLLVHCTAHFDELVERYVLKLLVAADIDGNLLVLGFAVADDNKIRILVVLDSSDLVFHVVVGVVHLSSYAVLFEEIGYLLCVVVVVGSDRNDTYLHR